VSRPIVIIGAGGHGRVVADLCRCSGRSIAGFLDPGFGTGARIDGIRVLGGDEKLGDADFVAGHDLGIGIGDSRLRCELGREILRAGGSLPALIHPSAVVASQVRIGHGSVLMAGCIVQCGSILEEFVVVNTSASVDHDAHLGEGTHVCPGAHLGGDVRTGSRAFIGVGAAVIPGTRIGEEAVIGAGAAVVRDVAARTTVVGCPARPISKSGGR
jgi:UDP-perosamine 4-acetyltransferase